MNVWPSVYILMMGARPTPSAESQVYSPLVRVGQAAGSTAMIRVPRPLRRFSRMNGNAMPPKFEPPPAQPMTMSGYSPAMSICLSASSPMTVWCRRTCGRNDPRLYFFVPSGRDGRFDAFGDRDAERTGMVGVLREDLGAGLGVRATGWRRPSAPKASITKRRNGFWS